MLFPILLFPIPSFLSDKKLLLKETKKKKKKNSHKIQSKWSIANYLIRGVWRGASEIFSKQGDYLDSREDGEN